MNKKAINIVWFKRDLRFTDHESLYLAQQEELPVFTVCLFSEQTLYLINRGGRVLCRGFLADAVAVAPEYEVAVEAVIGEKLDAIIIDSGWNASQIIEVLKTENKGQACFIPADIKGSEKPLIIQNSAG